VRQAPRYVPHNMTRDTQEANRVTPEIMAKYEAVIGLEVHAQLKTRTKAFCGCSTRYGDPPNSNTCPVCLGLPGALPVLNRRARELAIRAALALECKIQERSVFARKNYFYPDLPKGYQISQYELPLALAGSLAIEAEESAKRIGITRVHMEEDAAKNLHEGFADSDRWSYIDYNRCGTPLIEIVSEPDIRTPAEAYSYLTTLKQVLEYTEVSDCNMEEGSLRCDANVSVRLRGAPKFGTKVEAKNLNSFRYLAHALEYEIERQIGVIEAGGTVTQETRLWNVAAGRTEAMRSKEFAHDYRYFPDPDLLPLTASASLVAQVQNEMPELPAAKRARFVSVYGITPYDAGVLTTTLLLADYFEKAAQSESYLAKQIANWTSTELLRRSKDAAVDLRHGSEFDLRITPAELAVLVKKVEEKQITAAIGKKALAKMFDDRKSSPIEEWDDVDKTIAGMGLQMVVDQNEIEKIVRAVIAKSPDNLAKYRAGSEGVFKFFVGQVMKETRGQANPQVVNEILKRVLAGV
jgi:aspartyl-tRNA(Asn)/glutamyl-tRNA(Gln) amidotransferase subunit B